MSHMDLCDSQKSHPTLPRSSRSRSKYANGPKRLDRAVTQRVLMLELKKKGLHGCHRWICVTAKNLTQRSHGRRAAGVSTRHDRSTPPGPTTEVAAYRKSPAGFLDMPLPVTTDFVTAASTVVAQPIQGPS